MTSGYYCAIFPFCGGGKKKKKKKTTKKRRHFMTGLTGIPVIASLFKIVFYKLDNNHKTRMFGVSWPYGSQLNSICLKKGAV